MRAWSPVRGRLLQDRELVVDDHGRRGGGLGRLGAHGRRPWPDPRWASVSASAWASAWPTPRRLHRHRVRSGGAGPAGAGARPRPARTIPRPVARVRCRIAYLHVGRRDRAVERSVASVGAIGAALHAESPILRRARDATVTHGYAASRASNGAPGTAPGGARTRPGVLRGGCGGVSCPGGPAGGAVGLSASSASASTARSSGSLTLGQLDVVRPLDPRAVGRRRPDGTTRRPPGPSRRRCRFAAAPGRSG